jgi:hypothetical protein
MTFLNHSYTHQIRVPQGREHRPISFGLLGSDTVQVTSTPKMEAIHSSETLVSMATTRRHSSANLQRSEFLEFCDSCVSWLKMFCVNVQPQKSVALQLWRTLAGWAAAAGSLSRLYRTVLGWHVVNTSNPTVAFSAFQTAPLLIQASTQFIRSRAKITSESGPPCETASSNILVKVTIVARPPVPQRQYRY